MQEYLASLEMPSTPCTPSVMCINCVDERYTLGEILGAGSHATVYCAHDLISGQDVAVKLEHCTQDPSSLEHKCHILKKLQGAIGFP
ncbi:hypothetical protein JVU11DRAFT_8417 [Chiua virens]|nr:hypothetical protein JVU11DRAFT_8417 [Chiua virens]